MQFASSERSVVSIHRSTVALLHFLALLVFLQVSVKLCCNHLLVRRRILTVGAFVRRMENLFCCFLVKCLHGHSQLMLRAEVWLHLHDPLTCGTASPKALWVSRLLYELIESLLHKHVVRLFVRWTQPRERILNLLQFI